MPDSEKTATLLDDLAALVRAQRRKVAQLSGCEEVEGGASGRQCLNFRYPGCRMGHLV